MSYFITKRTSYSSVTSSIAFPSTPMTLAGDENKRKK